MSENLDPVLPTENESNNIDNDSNVDIKKQSEVTEAASLSEIASLSKEEIVEKLKNFTEQKEIPSRSEVEALKHAFYKIRGIDVENQKNIFIEDGNDPNEFVPQPDPSEEVVKTFLLEIKERRAKQLVEEERAKEENYEKKLAIIESIKSLSEGTDDFNILYKEFKDLQQQWNDIKQVPATKTKDLWKQYQTSVEKFYDLMKINKEFRDYDFKKNLELKISICESVEKLAEEEDVISAFHQLQNFHQQWREIGPVSKELREELWNRFKDASTTINKRYQAHFEELKSKEENNLIEKRAICDTLKNIDYSTLTTLKTWDEKSKEVIALQAKWKTIGFVPKKVNTQIFEEFRELCDKFFEKKSEYFKLVKDEMETNLTKKRALCDRANALKDSTDWKKTTDEMVAIQKEWKTIGPVSRKFSDIVWKEFVTACDYFFEQKNKNFSSQKDEEIKNLNAKRAIIEQIKNIDLTLAASEAIEQIKTLTNEWHEIGFVPFKEKDKVYKELYQAVDAHYERLKLDKTERRMDSFKSNIDDLTKSGNGERKLMRERDKLTHLYNKLKSDLQTYENNMSFLSVSSKSGNSLLKDIHIKIENLKNEMGIIEKKIEAIDGNLDQIEN